MSAGRVIGWILVAIGGAWTLLTGGCTAFFAYQGWRGMDPVNITTRPLGESVLSLSLMVGAVCILPGLVLLVIGVLVARGKAERKAQA